MLLLALAAGANFVHASAVEDQSVHKPAFIEEGTASFYGRKSHGRRTASGEIFNQADMTASHRKLAFGSRLRVTNADNGRSVVVRINDRGPFVKGRIIDLSKSAFAKIADPGDGLATVRIELLP